MTKAAARGADAPTAPGRSRWAGPLLAGLCFGVAYGVTQRLVTVNMGELIRFGQGFDVQVFPGTSYESLKLRFGAAEAELRGNLELQQLERQQAAEKAADQGADAKPAPEAEDPRPDALLDPDPLPAEPAAPERAAPEPPAAGRPAPPPAPPAPAAPPPAPGQ